MDFKTLPFELKSAEGDGSTFAGYANCFNNIDAAGEIVAPGAFKDRLAEFMAQGSTEVFFLGGINHQWDAPVGKVTSAKEDAKGLFIEGKLSQTQQGRDCMVLLKDGVLRKMSIGYKVLGDQMLSDAEEVQAYWKDVGYTPNASDIAASQYGARLLTKVYLYEASPVVAPANSLADITRVKRYDTDELVSYSDMEKCLRDVGLSQKAAKIWVSGFKALRQRDVEEAHTPEPDAAQSADGLPETEPTQPPEEPQITTEETKTEQPPIEAVVVALDAPAVVKADSRAVAARYANFLTVQARLTR